jgi:cysteine-rich repeat protein
MPSVPRQLASIIVGLGLATSATAATAQVVRTIEIDQLDDGTVFDGIIDGFPMLAAKDGTGDLQGNALGVAHKNEVTELRSAMEFPLAELADVMPEDILTATLTFNVDDVLSTFGPGTDFNGQAAATILVHPYDGDGAVALSDFKNRDEDPWTVPTGSTITDAGLNASGAVYFEVDVRDRLRAAVTGGASFLGFLWRTNDSPTGTSLDDLGEGSGGPPGARGSSMPFLTIEVEEPPPPPNCGNGQPDAGETCDDGNNVDGDCCSRNCQLDAAGTACSDGNACTDGDVCNAGGVCQTGAALDCDDGELCTADSCDAATGCVNLVAHEGEACDDQNVCTTDDVCGGGSCRGVPVPVGGCDDGDECTVGDTCTDGVCGGEALCGNGQLDESGGGACDEECDDGNVAALDGCSDVCTHDSVLGGRGRKECLLQVAFDAPVRDAKGEVAKVQRCTDGAPCDHEPAPNVCGFVLAACLGQADPRLPECSPVPLRALSLKKPGRKDVTNRTRFEEALVKTTFPGCTEPIQVDVKVKGARNPNSLLAPGRMRIVLATKAPGVGRDGDKVTLICDPPA